MDSFPLDKISGEKAMRRNQKYLVVGAGGCGGPTTQVFEVVECWAGGVLRGPENPGEKIVGVARREEAGLDVSRGPFLTERIF